MTTRTFDRLHRGMTFGFYARNGYYRSDLAKREVDQMAAMNIDWVVLIATVMQDTFSSTRQYRDFEITPGDDELMEIIDYIHSKGIKVQLRPMLETQDGHGRLQVYFCPDRERIPGRGTRYWEDWFRSMELRSRHYARIAKVTGCEHFGIDSELDRTVMPETHHHWKEVIKAVRSEYKGTLDSCHTQHLDFLEQLKDKSHWWYDLDSLSLSAYFEVVNKPGATVEELCKGLVPTVEYYEKVAREFGKPFYFGECGCTSSMGAAACPWGWTGEGGYAPYEQANYLEAVLRTFWDKPWWYGLYWWKWDEQNYREAFGADSAGDKGFIIKGKPAGDIMREWYSRKDISR